MNNVLENKLSSLIKYPGGKEKELHHILPSLPLRIDNYYEPFVGGGAVYFSIAANKYYINDRSEELISLYRMVKEQDQSFFEHLKIIDHNWMIISQIVYNHSDKLMAIYDKYKRSALSEAEIKDEISQFVLANTEEFNGMLRRDFNYDINNFVLELCNRITDKMMRMKKIEEQKGNLSYEDLILNMECSFKSAFYNHFRYLLNHKKEYKLSHAFATAVYFFIRQTCYSSMFRYNKSGLFNVPYGGISYNKKSFVNKIDYYESKALHDHLQRTVIGNYDFYEFMNLYPPKENDFVFLDPPYDTEFSTYAKNEFNKNDQIRLADYLKMECKANFMIVIKNTEFIASLYPSGEITANNKALHVKRFNKKYFVSFQDRNDKDAEHLLITNYEVRGGKNGSCKDKGNTGNY